MRQKGGPAGPPFSYPPPLARALAQKNGARQGPRFGIPDSSLASGQDGFALIGLGVYPDDNVPIGHLPLKITLNRNAATDRDRANHVQSPTLEDFRIVTNSLNVNRECANILQVVDMIPARVTDMSHIQSRRMGISGKSAGGIGYLFNSEARAQDSFCPSRGIGTPCQRRQA